MFGPPKLLRVDSRREWCDVVPRWVNRSTRRDKRSFNGQLSLYCHGSRGSRERNEIRQKDLTCSKPGLDGQEKVEKVKKNPDTGDLV